MELNKTDENKKNIEKAKKQNMFLAILSVLLVSLIIILLIVNMTSKNKGKQKDEDKKVIENGKYFGKYKIQGEDARKDIISFKQFKEEAEKEKNFNLEKINSEEEFEKIKKLPKVAILFTLPKCKPCYKQKEIYNEIREKNKNINIYIVDLAKEETKKIPEKYDIRLTPTTVILKKGNFTQKSEGLISKDKFFELFNK